jgi:hypothetical protein
MGLVEPQAERLHGLSLEPCGRPVESTPVSFEETGLYLYGTQKDGKQQRVGFPYIWLS